MTGLRSPNRPAVAIIGVNYGTDDMAVRFARSAAGLQHGGELTTIVVDNTEEGGRDSLHAGLRRVNQGLCYIQAPRNLGYFGGAALGLGQFVAQHGWPEWVIVSNVDIEFRDADLVQRLASGPWPAGVGVVAPSIWSSKSLRDLNPRLTRRPRAATMRFYKAVFANVYTLNTYETLAAAKHVLKYTLKKVASAARAPAPTEARRERIYAPQGSCIVFAREYFDRGGTLDYPQFLFGEEIYVAETARALGLQVIYEPRLRMWHDDHASTGLIRSRRVARHVADSARFIADRYFA